MSGPTKTGVVIMLFSALALTSEAGGAAQAIVNPSGQKIVVAGETAKPAAPPQKLTDKQKILADETDKLLEMATELQSQVGMTSRNILSMKVVRKAEEIELYARRMKDEAKKQS